jgi:hypothetical protein
VNFQALPSRLSSRDAQQAGVAEDHEPFFDLGLELAFGVVALQLVENLARERAQIHPLPAQAARLRDSGHVVDESPHALGGTPHRFR